MCFRASKLHADIWRIQMVEGAARLGYFFVNENENELRLSDSFFSHVESVK